MKELNFNNHELNLICGAGIAEEIGAAIGRWSYGCKSPELDVNDSSVYASNNMVGA